MGGLARAGGRVRTRAGGPRISGPNRRAFGLLKRVFKKVNSPSTHCNKSSSAQLTAHPAPPSRLYPFATCSKGAPPLRSGGHRLPPAPYPPAPTDTHAPPPPRRRPARPLKTPPAPGCGKPPPRCAPHRHARTHPECAPIAPLMLPCRTRGIALIPRPPLRNARSGRFAHARTHPMLPRIKAMLTCETYANSYLPIRLCDQPPVLFYNSLDVSRLAGHRIRAGIQGPMPVGACNP
jgi:hypothetical protein